MLTDTVTALLDAAETIGAEHGFQAASVRAMTQRAGANVAAVDYHFGGKDGLIPAMLARLIEPINTARLQALSAAGAKPTLQQVLSAWLDPMRWFCAARTSR